MKPYWRYEHSDLLLLLPFHRHQRHWLIRLTGRGPLPESVARYLCAGILMSFEDPRQSQDEVPSALRRFSQNPLSGFAPWILFSVIGGPSTWETASIAALIAAVLLVLIDIRAADIVLSRVVPSTGDRPTTPVRLRRPKLLDVATIVFFFGFVMAAGIANRHDVTDLDQYSQAISSGALGLIALGSVIFSHPFTIDYAKEATPREFWDTPVFKRINVVLTLLWAAVFLVCAGLGVAAVHVDSKGAKDWLNWYLPIALIIIGFKLNSWYPDRMTGSQRAEMPT